MNYNIFDARSTALRQAEGESDQAYMERLFRTACLESSGQNRVIEWLCPQFVSCDAAQSSLTMSFSTQDWMLNAKSTLHGGIVSTLLDTTMGLLSRWCKGVADVSTVTLDVHFLRAGLPGKQLQVHAWPEKLGRTVFFLRAELLDVDRACPIATATATFM